MAAAGPAKADLLQLGVECMRAALAALSIESTLSDVLDLVVTQAMKWLAPNAVIIGKFEPATQTLVVQAADPRPTLAAPICWRWVCPPLATRWQPGDRSCAQNCGLLLQTHRTGSAGCALGGRR